MLSKNALRILEERYLWRNEQGEVVERPEQMFRRVADSVALAETRWDSDNQKVCLLADKFFDAMNSGYFLPNSPTLMNAGKRNGQLSACFVLPISNSVEDVAEACKNALLIHRTGGGTGFSFSRLCPNEDPVVGTLRDIAFGPVQAMTAFHTAFEANKKNCPRSGANMAILRVDHPDIEEFIGCKRDTSKLKSFNISVAVTDEFMQAVVSDGEYDLINPVTNLVAGRRRAREIFINLVENAHTTGEPGLVFIDRINAADPVFSALDEFGIPIPGTEAIEATNPCGEQPLASGDACNLGSINVSAFVELDSCEFDWQHLGEIVDLGVRFLDDVIDVNHYPLSFIRQATLNNRRIGLGIMGWAEALIKLNIPYNSEEAIAKAEQLMRFVQERAHKASAQLAKERGNFPNWQFSTWKEKGVSMRNATVTTIAPTGTISTIAGTSSGIEPLFALAFVRRVLGGTNLIETTPLFELLARDRGFYTPELMQKIAREGTLACLEYVAQEIKNLWVCAHDISYSWHVRMQAAFQKYTDSAVSKTINFPREATLDDVWNAYLLAWQIGSKGITVYRDASRQMQVLSIVRAEPVDASVQHLGGRTRTQISAKQLRADLGRKVRRPTDTSCLKCNGGSQPLEARYESCHMCTACGYTRC